MPHVIMSKVGKGGMQAPYEAPPRSYGMPKQDVRSYGRQTFANVSEVKPNMGTGADTKGIARPCKVC